MHLAFLTAEILALNGRAPPNAMRPGLTLELAYRSALAGAESTGDAPLAVQIPRSKPSFRSRLLHKLDKQAYAWDESQCNQQEYRRPVYESDCE